MQIGLRQRSFINLVNVGFNLEGTILLHVFQGGQTLFGRLFRQPGHTLKDVAVILLNGDLLTRTIGRHAILLYTEASIRINAPGKLNPELILFPHLTDICLPGIFNRIAHLCVSNTKNRLTERNPLAGMGFITDKIMPLGGMAHRQHVVGKIGGFAPGWRKRRVQTDF